MFVGRPIGVVEVVGKEGDATFSTIDERLLRERCNQMQPLVISLRDAMRLTGVIKHSTSMVFGAKLEAEKGHTESFIPSAALQATVHSPLQLIGSDHIMDRGNAGCDEVCKTASGVKPLSRNIRQLRCLVADDSQVARKIIAHMIGVRLGHAVVEAADGAEACRLVEEAMRAFSSFDIVFLDCEMPGMDGPTAARQMVAMGFRGKIVGFTGLLDADTDAFRLYGVTTILEKPLNRVVIQQLLSGNKL